MRRSITAQFVSAFAALSAVVIATFVVMTVAVRNGQSADAARGRSFAVLATADELEQSVLDLETGLRGYLLTGKPQFLQPYNSALGLYPVLARRLETATVGEGSNHALSVSIASAISAYAAHWTSPVILLADHDLRAARRLEAGGGGKARVDAIRAQFATLLARETSLHSAQAANADSLAAFAFVAGLVGVGIFILVMTVMAIGTQRGLVAPLRRLRAGGVKIMAGDLSTRIQLGGVAELGELVSGFNVMTQSLEGQHDDLDDSRAELEAQKTELEAQQVELEIALATLEERNDYIELVRGFGDQLAAQSTLEEVAETGLQAIADAGQCELGAAYLLDVESGAFALAAQRGLDRSQLEPTLATGAGLAGRALAERRTVDASYGETSLRLPGLARGRDTVHELHLPILHGERTIGVISLGRVHDSAFSDDDRRLLQDLAERVAVDCAQAMSLRRLERTARSLGALLESTDEGIYGIDLDGHVTLVNRSALRQTGFSQEELLGHDAHELVHYAHRDGTPYPEAESPIYRSVQTGEGARITDEVFWRKDGSSFPVEYSAFPLRDGDRITGAVVTFLDVSVRQQLERQRNAQHALTRVLVDAALMDEARPRLLSAVSEELGFELGFTWEPSGEEGVLRAAGSYAATGFEDLVEILGAPLSTTGTLPGLALSRRQPVLHGDLALDPPRTDFRADPRLRTAVAAPILDRNGELITIAEFFSSEPLPEEGLAETLGAIAHQVAQHVDRQRADAEAQVMKDQFVANVSHELRTPLTAIDGWIHILLGEEPGPLTDDQRRFLETVKRNSNRLMRLVGDLLLAGQIEAGQLSLDLSDVDVSEVASETAELLSASAQGKRIKLTVNADAPVVVRGDRDRLAQLLSHLVANAIKFTPEDGSVSISVGVGPDACLVEVADSGIGIPAADREHLFERFYRASSATEHGIGGTGLGLAISKAIVESHGGKLELATGGGAGTVFVVSLPLPVREAAYT